MHIPYFFDIMQIDYSMRNIIGETVKLNMIIIQGLGGFKGKFNESERYKQFASHQIILIELICFLNSKFRKICFTEATNFRSTLYCLRCLSVP